ncbi:phosphoenolpyruvate carboxylase [Paraphotobacterium marinum]|uniref:Phosphoenolpyruvate carboxylase n=1 Tax=Paraphotobacterium marinum TaxID=1755811 RepID=A0A220VCS1_9GAMM|nr:phosphoenolpyruvate carboxylase [Paraphotobacterium marinum]ASK78026.1 phosphoenolpyruvate carboxylase [Paraphotobacterium marinum]
MNTTSKNLKSNINMLGRLLGNIIKKVHGEELLAKVEQIRLLSKSALSGNPKDKELLINTLQGLSTEEILPVSRAFSHFLNLTNIAEQFNTISKKSEMSICDLKGIDHLLNKLKNKAEDKDVKKALSNLKIDLVLTAHPTEITRRTIIHKLIEINDCLKQLELEEISEFQQNSLSCRLEELIAQTWHSDDIRKTRPTPIDEAKWGFAVIENSLWEAVPKFLRLLDNKLQKNFGYKLPANKSLINFSSWMGGDRDGNPFVTYDVTNKVLLMSQWKSSELFLGDLELLITELSMIKANEQLTHITNNSNEPYRYVLKKLKQKLLKSKKYLSLILDDEKVTEPINSQKLISQDELLEPLMSCYKSLVDCNMENIANGYLLDTIRRAHCFGINLLKLDIRQDSEKHLNAINEITSYLKIGSYEEWDEKKKIEFLIKEIDSERPLLPLKWNPSEETQEVLNTFKMLSSHDKNCFGAYVISMAKNASDILAVHLLLKEHSIKAYMPVCPLFETLDDLNNSFNIMQCLYNTTEYLSLISKEQMIMIGYSDSAKDAGVLASGWAQYKAMESLICLSNKNNIKLTLFHGRGGSIGRGGAPAHAALLSQPPQTLQNGLRVTEQGEMIRFKLGLPDVAINSLLLYTSAILEANILPPPSPDKKWRDIMESLSINSCNAYRDIVRHNSSFIDYFRKATPEIELGKLPLGSRPAKRKPNGGIESLRAIPWIFAWSQNRLLLPAWLGAGEAIKKSIDQGNTADLEEMCQKWPFFSTRLGMLEMVFVKANALISEYYEKTLVDDTLWSLGQSLREQLNEDIQTILQIENSQHLMSQNPIGVESIKLRNIYVEPLNMLQAELLKRTRNQSKPNSVLEEALMVTMTGIAAGLRNTG